MNWEIISSTGALISSVAAITAIVIGICQYRNTIERTDKQIAYLESEKNQKLEENRPLITIPKTFASGIKDYWQYKLELENIGVRPAYNFEVKSIVISVDNDFKNYELSDQATFSFANPIAKNTTISFFGNIYFKKYNKYYIGVSIKYLDNITFKIHKEDFYFRWEKIADKDYSSNLLYGMLEQEKNQFIKIKNRLEK